MIFLSCWSSSVVCTFASAKCKHFDKSSLIVPGKKIIDVKLDKLAILIVLDLFELTDAMISNYPLIAISCVSNI